MSDNPSSKAAGAIEHAAQMVQHSFQNMIAEFDSPFVRLRPKMYPDGNQWCALYGDDLQSGVAGFGDTPREAQLDFDKNWRTQKLEINREQ